MENEGYTFGTNPVMPIVDESDPFYSVARAGGRALRGAYDYLEEDPARFNPIVAQYRVIHGLGEPLGAVGQSIGGGLRAGLSGVAPAAQGPVLPVPADRGRFDMMAPEASSYAPEFVTPYAAPGVAAEPAEESSLRPEPDESRTTMPSENIIRERSGQRDDYTLAPHVGRALSSGPGISDAMTQYGGGTASVVPSAEGLSGQAWLDDVRAKNDPAHGFYAAAHGVWQDPNTGQPVGGQGGGFDPRPNGYDPPEDLYGGGGAVLFSGTGTQADIAGRKQAAESLADDAERRSRVASFEALAGDPYARERMKGMYEVRKAEAPAMIAAGSAQNVAKTAADSAASVQNLRNAGTSNVETIRGGNEALKEEARYASFDRLVDQRLQATLGQRLAVAQTSKDPRAMTDFQQLVADLTAKANMEKQRIREMGVTRSRDPYAFLKDQNSDPNSGG